MSEREEELVEVRRRKAAELRELGVHPFGTAQPVSHRIADVVAAAPDVASLPEESALAEDAPVYTVAGRVLAIRDFGKGAFLRIRDGSGLETQLFLRKDVLSEHDWAVYKRTDLGDYVRAEGPQFRTRRGDRAIRATAFTVLTKALRAPPEKWHGLRDKELRYRQRYLDLLANPEARQRFVVRTEAVRYIRRFLDARGFMEVETPMMHPLVSGAAARPFRTHHNALDLDLNLRIAPELYLKRLVVGGFERVYELGRNFRNEGLSPRHNPEFTMLEFYWAHATWKDLMDLTEELVTGLVRHLGIGREDDPYRITYQGKEIDFTPPWPRISMHEALLEHVPGLTEAALSDTEALRARALELADAPDGPSRAAISAMSHGELVGLLFEETVEAKLEHPTFVTGFPVEVSPLARRSDTDPGRVDRFELFIAGWEIANAFNELNDPDDQRERFERQVAQRQAGDEEAMDYDADYIRALEHGMPPTAGEGVGIDRLVMLLTDAPSIRDVILFPLLRPEGDEG
ncbi:MAG: lysine--tRNA ligase [Deltaproteobacteria bacterium]|nr:MAG: lysine--tRNA ligase [Deltaproteobacteria bacterium]